MDGENTVAGNACLSRWSIPLSVWRRVQPAQPNQSEGSATDPEGNLVPMTEDKLSHNVALRTRAT